MKRFLVFAACILLTLSVFAQRVKDYSFTHFSTSNGLVSNIVNSIAQDKDRFMWFGTIDGLQRYDGNNFITFRHTSSNPFSIAGDYITQITRDKKNNLWVWAGTTIGIFNTDNFRFTPIPIEGENKNQPPAIIFLGHAQNGTVAIYVDKKGLFMYNDKAKMFKAIGLFQFPAGWGFIDIRSIENGRYYWFGSTKGVAIFDAKTGNINYRNHNPDNNTIIKKMENDTIIGGFYGFEKSKLWYGSWPLVGYAPFINILDTITNERIQYSVGKTFNLGYFEMSAPLIQQNGRKWFCGRSFIVQYTGDEKEPFELISKDYKDEQSIRFDHVNQMYEDNQHNIWIATDNGIFLFNPDAQSFNNHNLARAGESEGIDGATIGLCELKNGNIFVGAWGLGLYFFDNKFNPIPLPSCLQHINRPYSIWSIHQHNSTGYVWFGMQGGEIIVYDSAANKAQHVKDKIFEGSTVRQITEDHFGNLWFGLQNGKVIKCDVKASNKNVQKSYIVVKQKDLSFTNKLFTDKDGFVWQASNGQGLLKFDPVTNKLVAHYRKNDTTENGLWSNLVFDIYRYNDSLLLIGDLALDILNTKTNKITHISTENGLPSNTVFNIQRDNSGALWLGMANQLCRFNLEKKIFSTYDKRDGIGYALFNPAAVFKLRDERIVYTTDRNFIEFNPLAIKDALTPPDPVITDFKLANKPLIVDSLIRLDKINLRYDNTSILIEFNTLNYLRQNKVHYYYMMEGLDKDWQETTNLNQAVYNYLEPGNYTFKVRAENSDGLSSKITGLHIIVTPPFWKTWWFLGIVILVAISIFYLVDRERIKRLQALQKVRTQIARNLHNDVNATLGNISLLSEMAKIKADKDLDRSKEYIDQISDKSRRMIDAMDDMLWSLNPENDSMEKTILRMKECAEGLQNTHSTHIQMEVDERVKAVKLDMKARHEFFLIFKEATRHVAEEANGSPTLINIDLSSGKLLMKIRNSEVNFNGIDADRSKKEMKQRAKLINAELDILCDKTGVSIILLVPVS